MSDELREALRESINEARAAEAAPAVSTAAVEPSPGADSSGAVGDGDGQAVDSTGHVEAGGVDSTRARGADGKFVKAGEAKTEPPKPGPSSLLKAKPVNATNATASPDAAKATSTAPKYRAPQSLRPALIDKWGELPETWQEEVDRLEREAKVGFQKNAEAAKFREAFNTTLAPYRPVMGNADPVKFVEGLAQSYYTLHAGPSHQKAQLLMRMAKQFGAAEDDLHSAFSEVFGGQTPQQGQQPAFNPQEILRQAREEARKEWEERQAEQTRAQQAKEIESFAASHEFFERLKPRMAGLLQGGVVKDLEAAYNEACWADSEVRAVLLQRERAQQANAGQASTQRKEAASSSVKSQPAPPPSRPEAGDTRDVLREELEAARRGR